MTSYTDWPTPAEPQSFRAFQPSSPLKHTAPPHCLPPLARIIFPFPTGVKRPGCWCFTLLRISPRLPYSLVNNVGARKQARSLITIVFFSIERARNPSLIPRPQPIANPFFYSPVPCVYHLFLFRLFIICLLSFGDRVFHLLAVWLYIFLSRWVRFSFFWVFAVFFFIHSPLTERNSGVRYYCS